MAVTWMACDQQSLGANTHILYSPAEIALQIAGH
jgi:hypothetical protein